MVGGHAVDGVAAAPQLRVAFLKDFQILLIKHLQVLLLRNKEVYICVLSLPYCQRPPVLLQVRLGGGGADIVGGT